MHAHNQWVHARPKRMFDGTVPDSDKTLHSGHVLGTTNIPFYDMIDSQTKTLKDKVGLQQGTQDSLPHSAILSYYSWCMSLIALTEVRLGTVPNI